jgi:hypothetical protein
MECDEPEECDGVNPTCPADGVKPNGTLCRGSAGICDVIENCDGVNFDCPADQLSPAAPNAAATPANATWPKLHRQRPALPAERLRAVGHYMRRSERYGLRQRRYMDGQQPPRNHEPAMTACGDAETQCINQDYCDGTGLCQHPAGNSGTECRAAAGLCDLAESCDGSNPTCPADVIRGVGEVCRPDQGECDSQEICDGVTVNCPPDITTPDGTPCGSPGDTDCSNPDSCLAGACDPNNEATSVQCRAASAGEACDAAEFCDGAGNCPADAPATTSVVCRPSVDVCDVADHCDGVSLIARLMRRAPPSAVSRRVSATCPIAATASTMPARPMPRARRSAGPIWVHATSRRIATALATTVRPMASSPTARPAPTGCSATARRPARPVSARWRRSLFVADQLL